jgi:GxxExxY protein
MVFAALEPSLNELSGKIIGIAYEVHSALGPGLLESVYKECMFHKLIMAGLHVVKEKPLPVIYDGVKLDVGFRLDLLVEEKIVLEIKSVDDISDVHKAQVLTYLKFANCRLGLLLNFNELKMKDGITRLIR